MRPLLAVAMALFAGALAFGPATASATDTWATTSSAPAAPITAGLNDGNNMSVSSLGVYDGYLWVGMLRYDGSGAKLYKSPSGNSGSFVNATGTSLGSGPTLAAGENSIMAMGDDLSNGGTDFYFSTGFLGTGGSPDPSIYSTSTAASSVTSASWTKINTGPNGWANVGSQRSFAPGLVEFGGSMYVGTQTSGGNPQIWAFTDSTNIGSEYQFTKVVDFNDGTGLPGGLAVNTVTSVTKVFATDGKLWVGVADSSGARLYSSVDGTNWTENSAWNTDVRDSLHSGIPSIVVFNGDVVVSVSSGTGAQLWSTNDDGATWNQLGTDGLGDTANEELPSMLGADPTGDDVARLSNTWGRLWTPNQNSSNPSGGGTNSPPNSYTGTPLKVQHTTDGSSFSLTGSIGFGQSIDQPFVQQVAFLNSIYVGGSKCRPLIASCYTTATSGSAFLYRLQDSTVPTAPTLFTAGQRIDESSPYLHNPSSGSYTAYLYYHPNHGQGPQSFTIHSSATDNTANPSGIMRMDYTPYNGMPAGPTGITNDTGGPGIYEGNNKWSQSYSVQNGAEQTAAGILKAKAFDYVNAAGTNGSTLTTIPDKTAPTGGSISYSSATNPTNSGTSGLLTFAKASELQSSTASGFNTWTIQRDEADLVAGTCQAYTGTYVDVISNPAGTTAYDATRQTDKCYKYQIVFTDNVGNIGTKLPLSSPVLKVDNVVNSNAITSSGAPTNSSGTISVTGDAADTASTLSSVTVTYTGPSSGTICSSQPASWSCNWNLSGLSDGTYTIHAVASDSLSNTSEATQVKVIDRTNPTASLASVTESSAYAYFSGSGSSVYFNPGAPSDQDITVNITASDAGTGINDVSFPDLGTIGWTPAGGSDTTGPSPYSLTYTFASGANEPALYQAVANDLAGNSSAVNFNFDTDNTAPTAGSVSYANGYTIGATANITFNQGSDAASGIATAQLERRTAALSAGACGSYSGWSATAGQVSPVTENLTSGTCYEYQLVVTDNVNNTTTYTSANTIKADSTAPTGALTGPSTPTTGAVFVTGSSDDTYGGVANVTVTYTGPSSGAICSGVLTTINCGFNSALLTDGSYVIHAVVTDAAGNSFEATRNVVFDQTAPSHVLFSVNGSPNVYYPGSGDVIWYKQGIGADQTADVTVSASDVTSGLLSTSFPDLTAPGWTGGGAGSFVSGTLFHLQYTWANGANDPASKNIVATDNALNPSNVAIDFNPDITAPDTPTVTTTNGYVVTNSVNVMHTNGAETESGIGLTQLRRRTASLANGLCGSFGAWGVIGSANPTLTYNDASISNANCYQYQLESNDNVGNQTVVDGSDTVKVDTQAPAVTFNAPSGSIRGNTVSVNGTASDGESGLTAVAITYTGQETGTVCASAPSPATWACNWDTTSVGNGAYVLHADGVDAAGNHFDATANVTVDNSPPSISLYSASSPNGFVYYAGAGTTIWYNSAKLTDQTADIFVTASDTPSGIASVDFPNLATAGWAPGGGTGVVGPDNHYDLVYTFSMGAGDPAMANVTATDNAGNQATTGFDLTPDGAAPAGGNVTYANSLSNATTTDVTWAGGADGGSAIANRHLWRKEATLTAGGCGAFGSLSDLGAVAVSPFTDSTIQTGKCYRYELWETDNVNNVAQYTSPNTLQVDSGAPVGSIDAPTSASRGNFNVQGQSSDAATGITNIDVTFTGPTSGTICLAATPEGGWSCAWDTTGLNGNYTVHQLATDGAGNTSDITLGVMVDNTSPSGSLSAVNESSTNVFYPGAGTTIWYNASVLGGSAELVINATDALSGVQGVNFPDLATLNWAGSGSGASGGPDLYKLAYSFASGAADPALNSATVTDVAGNTATSAFDFASDATPPASGSVSYPDGLTNVNDAAVTFAGGVDGESGTATVNLQRQSAQLLGGVCQAYGGFATIAVNPTSIYHDTTMVTDNCYEYRIVTIDNVGNSTTDTSPNEVKYDATDPVASVTGPVGPINGAVNVTGTSDDSTSGIANVDVEFTGPTSGTICLGAATPASWSCPWNTAGLNGSYTITVTATDNVGNVGVAFYSIDVDNTVPTASFNSFVEQSGPQYLFASSNEMYFNPNQAGGFDVRANATDTGSGINDLLYPDVDGAGGLWSPSGVQSVTTGPTPYSQTYSWSAGATSPGLQTITVNDNAGNFSTVLFTLTADSTAPGGGSASYPAYRKNGEGTVDVTIVSPTDGGSGPATTQLQRASATLSNGSCGTFTAFSDIGGANPASPYTDATIASGNCYQYQLVAIDNVGNSAAFAGGTVQVDAGIPTGSFTAPTNPWASGSIGNTTFSGTSSDALTGVANVDVTYAGASSGNICLGAVTPTSWSCDWNTSLVVDGDYVVTATYRDGAGNTATATKNIRVYNSADGTNPAASFVSLSSPSASVHVSGSTAWFNPAMVSSANVTVVVNATDAESYIDRVTFPTPGAAGWSGGGDDTTPDGSNNFQTTYVVNPGASEPGVVNILAKDNAANTTVIPIDLQEDATAPTGVSISYSDAATNMTNVDITYSKGTDADSGIATAKMQRRSATLTGGTCGAYSGFADLAGPNMNVTSYNDGTIASGNCYQYRMVVTDNVGRATTTVPAETVKVDAINPSAVTLSSSTHVVSVWSGTAVTNVTVAGATDANTSIAGYKVVWDAAASTVPTATLPVTSASSALTSPTLADGTSNYVHVRAVDAAGNFGPTAHFGPIMIDLTLPPAPTMTVTPFPFALTAAGNAAWTATDATAGGLASYDIHLRTSTFGGALGAPSLWQNAVSTTTVSAPYSLNFGVTACFSGQSRDSAGNVSGFSTPENCTSMPQKAASMKAVKKWIVKASGTAFGGRYRQTSVNGAMLTFNATTAMRVSVVYSKCKTCGSFDVFFGSTKLGRIVSKGATKHKVMKVFTFAAPRSGILKFKAIKTGPLVQIEGAGISPL